MSPPKRQRSSSTTNDNNNSRNGSGGRQNNIDDEIKMMKEKNEDDNTKRLKNNHIQDAANTTTTNSKRYKILSTMYRRTNDEIHSTIIFDPITNAIIDTPPMQRLRGLKQLSVDDLVYVNVNHTRFEHSLGVAHLAEKLCDTIRQRQPQLDTTNKDVLCVKLSGLLHDIGHGPFSHMYEDFITQSLPKYINDNPNLKSCYDDLNDIIPNEQDRPYHKNSPSSQLTHEEMSLKLIDSVLEYLGLAIDINDLDRPLKEIGSTGGVDAKSFRCGGWNSDNNGNNNNDDDDEDILTSRDIIFIKECILGKPIPELQQQRFDGLNKGFIGRTEPHQQWMYDIVANTHNGLDVDKVDYFARDERRSMRASGEIDKVMIEEAVVAWADCNCKGCCRVVAASPRQQQRSKQQQHLMICYPEKLAEASINFFKKRFELFTKIYKHKTCSAAQFMVRDILCYADPYLRIPNSKSKIELPISCASLDPHTFLDLRDDDIIGHILLQKGPEYDKAKALIRRLRSRDDLYKRVATRRINSSNEGLWELSEQEITSQLMEEHHHHNLAINKNTNNGMVCGCCDDLQPDDFIIDKCHIHHGSKDQNPLLKMRFLPKNKLKDIVNQVEHLPVAEVVDEDIYEAHLPRSFQQREIQVFSRGGSDKFDPTTNNKNAYICQIFDIWCSKKETSMDEAINNEHPAASRFGGRSHGTQNAEGEGKEANGPVPLTPEDEESDCDEGGEEESDDNDGNDLVIELCPSTPPLKKMNNIPG